MSFQAIRAQLVRCKTFSSPVLEPASPPVGTSIEEKVNAWLSQNTERQLLQIDYEKTSNTFTVLLFYTE